MTTNLIITTPSEKSELNTVYDQMIRQGKRTFVMIATGTAKSLEKNFSKESFHNAEVILVEGLERLLQKEQERLYSALKKRGKSIVVLSGKLSDISLALSSEMQSLRLKDYTCIRCRYETRI